MTSRADLQKKPIADLRQIAQAIGVESDGLQKAKLISAILDHPDTEVIETAPEVELPEVKKSSNGAAPEGEAAGDAPDGDSGAEEKDGDDVSGDGESRDGGQRSEGGQNQQHRDGQNQQGNGHHVELFAGLMRNGTIRIDFRRLDNPFRRDLVHPGNNHSRDEAQGENNGQVAKQDVRGTHNLENNVCYLRDHPGAYQVGNAYPEDIAALEFVENLHWIRLSGVASSTKRGSSRMKSQSGLW